MITSKELRSIDRSYFDVVEATPFYIVLRSKNTDHYWYLLEQEYRCFRSFKVSHKHHETDSYHLQTCKKSIISCCLYIKGHNAYHLQRIHMKMERRRARLNL